MIDADRGRALRDATLAYLGTLVLVAALLRIDVTLPAIGHLGSALVAVLFLYVPVFFAWRRREDLDDYGFHTAPVRDGLVTAGVAMAIAFPIFIAAYFAFYEVACHSQALARFVPPGMCMRYGGLGALHVPPLALFAHGVHDTALSLEWCAVEVVVVALPEELFFRGFLLRLLEQRFPPKRRWKGGGIGLALVLSSLAFALVHLPREGDPRALATFAPGLLFGWMRSRTGSILASTATHASANILIRAIELAVSR